MTLTATMNTSIFVRHLIIEKIIVILIEFELKSLDVYTFKYYINIISEENTNIKEPKVIYLTERLSPNLQVCSLQYSTVQCTL